MTKAEIARELRNVRALLRTKRANGEDISGLYGAQQALAWVVEGKMAPSKAEAMIDRIAEDYHARKAGV
jgi:hypothetical protein